MTIILWSEQYKLSDHDMDDKQSTDAVYEIAGAGPAGLTAAIVLAQAGKRVIVHEAKASVGNRFGGDFQGLENWTTHDDVLAVMKKEKPDDPYVVVTEGPAWQLLDHLDEIADMSLSELG